MQACYWTSAWSIQGSLWYYYWLLLISCLDHFGLCARVNQYFSWFIQCACTCTYCWWFQRLQRLVIQNQIWVPSLVFLHTAQKKIEQWSGGLLVQSVAWCQLIHVPVTSCMLSDCLSRVGFKVLRIVSEPSAACLEYGTCIFFTSMANIFFLSLYHTGIGQHDRHYNRYHWLIDIPCNYCVNIIYSYWQSHTCLWSWNMDIKLDSFASIWRNVQNSDISDTFQCWW